MEAETRYADSNGVSIAYQVHGEGPLDLVFVPGFVSHVEFFWDDPLTAGFLRRLASFARVVIWDKRGQGLSDRTGRPPTLEDSMDDLEAVLAAASCERPAIFGISEGGPMSALFAATHPDRVSSLVLYGTYARMLRAPDFPQGIPSEALERWGEVVKRDWGGPVGVGIWAPSAEGDADFERWWSRLLRYGTSPAGAVALMDLYREIDVRGVLPAIDVPALVLQRRDDRISTVGQGRYIAEAIPGAKYVELEGADHLPVTGDSDALLDEVEEFLVGSRRGSEPERALATVLFTDIVGSTERAAELGDRGWRQLLERHDAAVRRQLDLYRGREVKTMGDGFLATFDGPARAIPLRPRPAGGGGAARARGAGRHPHRRGRADRRRRRRHGGQHRRPDRRPRRLRRSPRLQHGARARRRFRPRVRRPRRQDPEGRPRRMAPICGLARRLSQKIDISCRFPNRQCITLGIMEAMARESWTDARLDDLNGRMSEGFQRVDADIHDLRRMMFQGFIAMATIMVTCFAGLASLIAF